MKNKAEQDWKEKTKLDKRNVIMISFYILMAIFEVIVAIAEKDFIWIICAILWGNIAIIEYCNAKMMKGKEVIIDLQERNIEIKDKIIKHWVEEIDMLRNTKILEITDIKIPKDFKKPSQAKMKNRFEYYKQYNKFEVPIIVDKNNTLIDGYTSYLIAKQDKFTKIEVRIV